MPADMPPSTGRLTPVMLDARSDARNSAALAQSSGSIGRPIGCSDDIDSRIRAAAGPSGSMPATRVVIPPRQTELTRMPCAAASSTSARVRLTTARSEEQPSELQSLMRHPYAVFCLHQHTQIYNLLHESTTTCTYSR